MKPTDVDSLSDPLCPERDVRPRHNFHVNITLTSFPSSKTHILLSSHKTADRRRLNTTHVRYPCRTYYAHLTTDVRSHQFEKYHSRYSMDRLYIPKNLWVSRLRYVFLFSGVRDARSQARNCNQIQTNCSLFSSPFVPSYPIIINSHTFS